MDRSHWGGLPQTLAECPDFRSNDQLPSLYRQGFEYLDKMSATRTIPELIHVMSTIPWPHEEKDHWVNALNSPLLDTLFQAFLAKNGRFTGYDGGDTIWTFGELGSTATEKKRCEYLRFVGSILLSNREDAFQFICDRGFNATDPPHFAICRVTFSGSSVKILKHVIEKLNLEASQIQLYFKSFVKHPDIAEYLRSSYGLESVPF